MFRIGGLEPAEYNHGHSPQGDTASEQRKAMESSHGETAGDGHWVFWRRCIERPAEGGGAISRRDRVLIARDSCAHMWQSARCRCEAERECSTTEWKWNCIVRLSEVMGSSGVRATSTRNWNLAFYHLKQRHIPQGFNQEFQIFTSVSFYTAHRYALRLIYAHSCINYLFISMFISLLLRNFDECQFLFILKKIERNRYKKLMST
jgi:hypothetical protein